MEKIKSIEEMCAISKTFKANLGYIKEIDKSVSKSLYCNEQDIREHIRTYANMLYGVMLTYNLDLEKPIDIVAIDEEIDKLREKAIESALKALEKLKAERKKA